MMTAHQGRCADPHTKRNVQVSEIDSRLTDSTFCFRLLFSSFSILSSLLRLLFSACFGILLFFLPPSIIHLFHKGKDLLNLDRQSFILPPELLHSPYFLILGPFACLLHTPVAMWPSPRHAASSVRRVPLSSSWIHREDFLFPSTVFVVVILHRDLSRHGGLVVSP